MYNKSMWWLFLLIFGLTIAAIQSLGWWTRQASAQTASARDPVSIPAGKHVQTCEPMHWRSMVMHR